jgi:eukaryotic-like serine/threonine-protein kinase
VPDEPNAISRSVPISEFLSGLERSGILPEAKLRDVYDRFVQGTGPSASTALAVQLVKEGMLTEFQARRLLGGKKSLVFGRYLLLDHIGIGAMGRVFKARHRLMDRVVALKVLSPSRASAKNAVARLLQEMKIVGLLDHPNVVRAFDADQHDNSPYIVMEYLQGENLEQLLAHHEYLPPHDVIEYMAQASWGLAHAHEKGVIHRDVKPTNLFLVNTGVVKVLDLGLGAFVGVAKDEADVFDTDEGIVVGTTDYMSPEQVTGRAIDARTDLFSLGCTMYRLLTGAFAFPGITKEDRLAKRIHERYVPATDVRPDLPVPVVAILDRLLSRRPADRFSSAVEVAEALEAITPPTDQPDRGARGRTEGKRPRPEAPSSPPEPEAPPLDWSVIESSLRSKGETARRASPSERRATPKQYAGSTRRLSSYSGDLEDEGADSGRKVHEDYRKELIQLKRAQEEESVDDQPSRLRAFAASLLERIGEQIGDFLAEPNAGVILIAIVVIIFMLVVALFVGFV